MDRRSFFRFMIGGVAATTAVRTWPFRVFSFPTNLAMSLPDFTDKYIKPIRFINAFDPAQPRMLTRFDAIYGFPELDRLHGLMDEWNKNAKITVRIAS